MDPKRINIRQSSMIRDVPRNAPDGSREPTQASGGRVSVPIRSKRTYGGRGVTRCRILVVEDEAITAMLVEEMVLDFGSEVVGPAAKMRLLSDRASPRSRSGLNQQAVHLRPRHRCDQARHEPLFGRAALRAFRPIATQPPGITRHHTLALAENEFLAADRRRGLHITSVLGNFSDRIPKTIADWSSRIAARYPALT